MQNKEKNKTIKLELTRFEAEQLKANHDEDSKIALWLFGLMFAGLFIYTVSEIIKGQILFGFIMVITLAYGINLFYFDKHSVYNHIKASKSIFKKLNDVKE